MQQKSRKVRKEGRKKEGACIYQSQVTSSSEAVRIEKDYTVISE